MKPNKFINLWKNEIVVCIASGPSLKKEDCDLIAKSQLKTIVVNTSYQLCLWADVLFAFDLKWWLYYDRLVSKSGFKGEKVTHSFNAQATMDITSLDKCEWFEHFGNSGSAAISLAINTGARRILLLGYDCSLTADKPHWHGKHPEGFNNCKSINYWPKQFKNVSDFAKRKDVEIINCSRETTLTCFDRMDLLDALQKD